MLKEYYQIFNEMQGSTSWKNILKNEHSEDALHEYYDRYNDIKNNMISDMVSHKKQHFSLVLPEQLKRIYKEHQELGFVRNEKLLDSIIDKCVVNTIKLQVNTLLAGHTTDNPYYDYKEQFEDGDEELLSEEEFEELIEEYVPDRGFSDYGLTHAVEITIRLLDAKTDNDKIVLLNHLFDIIHQRSDFVEYYIIGGSNALSQISGTEYGLED